MEGFFYCTNTLQEETMKKIINYFTTGITSKTLETIGAEIETQFVNENGEAITIAQSQRMLQWLISNGWTQTGSKGNLVTSLTDQNGNAFFYELGRHNIELATVPLKPEKVIAEAKTCLNELYKAAESVGAFPHFNPILESNEDLLVILDERDAVWLDLDGKENLMHLARSSSVQFTFSVSIEDAIPILNKLGEQTEQFLANFPQDKLWKKYIAQSHADYLPNRYGGPLHFTSIEDYCKKLTEHDVVQGAELVPHAEINKLNIPLFIRSVWWHFRLKRYENALCIEVRPTGRYKDEQLEPQLEKILSIISAL